MSDRKTRAKSKQVRLRPIRFYLTVGFAGDEPETMMRLTQPVAVTATQWNDLGRQLIIGVTPEVMRDDGGDLEEQGMPNVLVPAASWVEYVTKTFPAQLAELDRELASPKARKKKPAAAEPEPDEQQPAQQPKPPPKPPRRGTAKRRRR